ncbi:hypothetical protein SprV_0200603400 [Sparganum proliferum]
MMRWCSWEEHAIVIAVVETMGAQHPSPDSMACANAGVEVTKDDQLIRVQHSHQEGVHVHVEFVSCGVSAGHWRDVGADDGGKFASPKRQAEAHQTIVGVLRQTGQASHDVVQDGKSDARVA